MVVKESVMESVTEYAFSFRLWESVFSISVTFQEFIMNGTGGACDEVCF